MKLIKKENLLCVSYLWEIEEIKGEKDIFRLIASIATIGELRWLEFSGYEDMDIHENWASFSSLDEFKNGLDKIRKIDADGVDVKFDYNGEFVIVGLAPINESEYELRMSLVCETEETGEELARILEKKVKEIVG